MNDFYLNFNVTTTCGCVGLNKESVFINTRRDSVKVKVQGATAMDFFFVHIKDMNNRTVGIRLLGR